MGLLGLPGELHVVGEPLCELPLSSHVDGEVGVLVVQREKKQAPSLKRLGKESVVVELLRPVANRHHQVAGVVCSLESGCGLNDCELPN